MSETIKESSSQGISKEDIKNVLKAALEERSSDDLNRMLDSMGNFW
jgi:hypothetical protein